MFFVLAKILGFFALPSNILITLGLLGVLLLPTRFARAGRRLLGRCQVGGPSEGEGRKKTEGACRQRWFQDHDSPPADGSPRRI